jgi:hypothetical protein
MTADPVRFSATDTVSIKPIPYFEPFSLLILRRGGNDGSHATSIGTLARACVATISLAPTADTKKGLQLEGLERPKSAVVISFAFVVLRLVGQTEPAVAIAGVQTCERQ